MLVQFITGTIRQISELTESNDTSRIQFSIPEERYVKGETRTVWHNLTAWGKTAERLAQYAHNGTVVTCQFRLDYNTASNGNRYTNLTVTDLEMHANYGASQQQEAAL